MCRWDARKAAPALRVRVHAATDVNVLSWNRLASCMLASGADDGVFRIWDLRSFADDAAVASFSYHRGPVTAVQWSPFDPTTLITASEDSEVAIWDLALERDEEEEMELQQGALPPDSLPPQLLFNHLGQDDVREARWHPQVSGLVVTSVRARRARCASAVRAPSACEPCKLYAFRARRRRLTAPTLPGAAPTHTRRRQTASMHGSQRWRCRGGPPNSVSTTTVDES